MYKIIGADGREYGPASAEEVRRWITERRADAHTRAQAAGSAEWKPLGEFPEFADALRPPASAPPVLGAVDPEALAAEILARDYTVEIARCIGRGWQLVKANFWLLVGASFVAGLIAGGGGLPWIGPVIGLILGGPMMGGLFALYLKRIRGQPATFGDAFAGFSLFVPLMLAQIVSGLLTGLGLLLCVLPGIYLGVSWVFVLPLVMDKRLEFWPAMELSRKVVSRHWWQMFGLLILCGLVTLAGLLACCVGIIVTGAVAEAALMFAYEDIFGTRPATTA